MQGERKEIFGSSRGGRKNIFSFLAKRDEKGSVDDK